MFIAVEGIDGSGKSTLSKSLSNDLEKLGHANFLTKEPTDDFSISDIDSSRHDPYTGIRLLFRFTEDRYVHQAEIMSHLEKGELVISDRYIASTLAYQGAIIDQIFQDEKETVKWMDQVSCIITVRPDITIYLDVEPEAAIRRISGRPEISGFEETQYLRKVREFYKAVLPEKTLFLDSSKGRDIVRNKALDFILEELPKPH